jgi:two-component system chemotaxis response regulator CheY
MKKILIVEDDVDLRLSLTSILEREGYSVTQAGNGDIGQFLSLLSEYDLLISDINMPEVDGITMVKFLKSKVSVPVILITGLEKENVKEITKEAQAELILFKPFSYVELLQAVDKVLSGRP